MIAVVPVRGGTLPLGAEETVAEAGGRVLLVGSGTDAAAARLAARPVEVSCWEVADAGAGRQARTLAPHLRTERVVLLPGSPDGRDLAPRLALALDRPLHAPALRVEEGRVVVVRGGGLQTVEHAITGPVVATLQPGARGVDPPPAGLTPRARKLDAEAPRGSGSHGGAALTPARDSEPLGLVEAAPGEIELAEARRVVGAGAGLGSPATVAALGDVAAALGATLGGTRVVTDAGWLPVSRQIGTTGVVVDPELYLAVGIAGAVQHVSGLGQPDVVIAVNTDASCPMMLLADLAVVTDGPGFVAAMAARLGLSRRHGAVA